MKQQIEKIQALLLRNQIAAAQHELEILMQMYEEHLLAIEASDRIKDANLYQAEYSIIGYKEDVKLRDERIEQLTKEHDTLLAEREQWMKQEPVAYVDLYTGRYTFVATSDKEIDLKIGSKLYAHQLPAQQVPEGWQLVPIEPTDAMDEAYCKKAGVDHLSLLGYRAMLSAAPKQEEKAK